MLCSMVALGLNLGQPIFSYVILSCMTRRNIEEEQVRNIQKSKRSYYITLPICDIRTLGWREGQRVIVQRSGKKLIVEDWNKK